MSKHIQVPLKNLRFGHEAPHHPGNARVTGREDDIATLASHIHVRGKIDDLLVYEDGVPDVYFVSNGNRSLAALRMIYGAESEQWVDCKLTTAEQAYEDSLAVAVLVKKFHPVDEYEGYARLRDEKGKTEEEIAHQYGKTAREVQQVLALGHLSPVIRDLWRKGEIKTEAAKAFTLAPDHKAQEDILAAYVARTGGAAGIMPLDIRQSLKIGNDNIGTLVEFVGIDAYTERGGSVTRDLFGTNHVVSDAKLVKKLAAERLQAECDKLVQSGWSFAVPSDSVKSTRHEYTNLKVQPAIDEAELDHLRDLNAVFNPMQEVAEGSYAADCFADLTAQQQQAFLDYRALMRAINLRAYTPDMMASAGCFVGVDHDGLLTVEFGKVKPEEKAPSLPQQTSGRKSKAAAKPAGSEAKPEPEAKVLSSALVQRLEIQMIAATRDAIAAEPQLANSALFETLAKTVCAQIVPDRPLSMPDAIRTKLPSIRQALNPGVFNAAIARHFDAADYFGAAPKAFVIKAIAESINEDEARRVASKPKDKLAEFAIANLAKSGWLPKELRTVHYKGPGSEGYKRPAAAEPADVPTAMQDALEKAEKALKPLKRAAAIGKAVRAVPVPKPSTTRDSVKKAKAARDAKKTQVAANRLARSVAKKKKR